MEVSLCCHVWPQTHRDPPSACLGLGLQLCTSIPAIYIFLKGAFTVFFLSFLDCAPAGWGRHISSDWQLWDCPGNGEWPESCALSRLGAYWALAQGSSRQLMHTCTLCGLGPFPYMS